MLWRRYGGQLRNGGALDDVPLVKQILDEIVPSARLPDFSMTVSMLSDVRRGEHGEALGEVCISYTWSHVLSRRANCAFSGECRLTAVLKTRQASLSSNCTRSPA